MGPRIVRVNLRVKVRLRVRLRVNVRVKVRLKVSPNFRFAENISYWVGRITQLPAENHQLRPFDLPNPEIANKKQKS